MVCATCMGKFDGVLLVSDFCDTLIDVTWDFQVEDMIKGKLLPIPERNRQAVAYFMSNGGRFTIATGRVLKYFQPYADSLPVNAPIVLCDGVAVYDLKNRKYVETAFLDEQDRELAQTMLDRFPTMMGLACYLDDTVQVVHPDDDYCLLIKSDDEIQASPQLKKPFPARNLRFKGRDADLKEIGDFFRAKGREDGYELLFSEDNSLIITAKGANKGSMVRRLARRLGTEHIFCVGDGRNDLSMLAIAEESFAPVNCEPEVYASGATTVCPARDGVLGDVVERLDKRF